MSEEEQEDKSDDAEASGESKQSDDDNKKKRKKWSGKRKWLIAGFTLLLVILGALYGGYYFFVGRFYVNTDDAYVAGNKISLMPQIAGTVTAIHVQKTDFVKRGQLLVTLDDTDAKVAFAQAKANLAQTVRQVTSLFAAADQERAQIRLQQAALKLAKQNFRRSQLLVNQKVITPQQFDKRSAELDEAKANLSMAKHQLNTTQAKISGTTARNHPQVKLAEAAVRKAYLNLKRTRIYAPVSGYVARRPVQVGQEAAPGTPMMVIVPLDNVWVDANFKETDLAKVRVGQPVTLTADLYGSSATYHGKVDGFSPGTGSSFELLPPQNATGNWIKVVRRLPVRVTLKGKELKKHPLYVGLSMSATVDVHKVSGPRLAKQAPRRPSQATGIYKKRMRGVEKIIERIVKENIVSPATQPATQATKRAAKQ